MEGEIAADQAETAALGVGEVQGKALLPLGGGLPQPALGFQAGGQERLGAQGGAGLQAAPEVAQGFLGGQGLEAFLGGAHGGPKSGFPGGQGALLRGQDAEGVHAGRVQVQGLAGQGGGFGAGGFHGLESQFLGVLQGVVPGGVLEHCDRAAGEAAEVEVRALLRGKGALPLDPARGTQHPLMIEGLFPSTEGQPVAGPLIRHDHLPGRI